MHDLIRAALLLLVLERRWLRLAIVVHEHEIADLDRTRLANAAGLLDVVALFALAPLACAFDAFVDVVAELGDVLGRRCAAR
jgi:hypothetical protein